MDGKRTRCLVNDASVAFSLFFKPDLNKQKFLIRSFKDFTWASIKVFFSFENNTWLIIYLFIP